MEKITSTNVLKQIQKQIKNYSEDELIEFLDIVDNKQSKYNNKIQSRLSSAKAAGKTILCVDGSQIFGDGNILVDMVFIDWVNNILSQNETAETRSSRTIMHEKGVLVFARCKASVFLNKLGFATV